MNGLPVSLSRTLTFAVSCYVAGVSVAPPSDVAWGCTVWVWLCGKRQLYASHPLVGDMLDATKRVSEVEKVPRACGESSSRPPRPTAAEEEGHLAVELLR